MLYKCNTFALLFLHKYIKGKVMKVKRLKILKKIILLSLMTVSIIYAAGLLNFSDTSAQITYSNMSTMELQEEVERLSQNGDVPFRMGMELIKRWTNNNVTIASY
jgi:ABC-type protease/lipase transport system fused ATPase/permease subunit